MGYVSFRECNLPSKILTFPKTGWHWHPSLPPPSNRTAVRSLFRKAPRLHPAVPRRVHEPPSSPAELPASSSDGLQVGWVDGWGQWGGEV